MSINGKVIDNSGESLPGVTVIKKGTVKGTITDIDGNYSMSASSGDVSLVFSFIGMRTQEIPKNNQSTINCTLAQNIIRVFHKLS